MSFLAKFESVLPFSSARFLVMTHERDVLSEEKKTQIVLPTNHASMFESVVGETVSTVFLHNYYNRTTTQ